MLATGGSDGNVFESELSEDLFLAIVGLISSVDTFSWVLSTDVAGLSSVVIGVMAFVGTDEGVGSGFLSANTECPDTELLLLVLVKNEGLGRGADRSDGPNGCGLSSSVVVVAAWVAGAGRAGTLFSGWKIDRREMKLSPRGLAKGERDMRVDVRSTEFVGAIEPRGRDGLASSLLGPDDAIGSEF